MTYPQVTQKPGMLNINDLSTGDTNTRYVNLVDINDLSRHGVKLLDVIEN